MHWAPQNGDQLGLSRPQGDAPGMARATCGERWVDRIVLIRTASDSCADEGCSDALGFSIVSRYAG